MLQKYLWHRNAEDAAADDAANLGVNRILTEGFIPSNGATSVPVYAIRVLNKVHGTNPEVVWRICQEALKLGGDVRLGALRRALGKTAKRDPEFAEICERIMNEIVVLQVMER